MSFFSVLVFTRKFHRDFESLKFNNYILANCHETSRTIPHLSLSHGPQQNCTSFIICLGNWTSYLLTLHDLQRRYLANPPIVVDCIKLTNASTFLKTWFKIQCSFLSKNCHEIHINSIGSKVASQFLTSHQQPMPIVSGSLHLLFFH